MASTVGSTEAQVKEEVVDDDTEEEVDTDTIMEEGSDGMPYCCCFPGCSMPFMNKVAYGEHFATHVNDEEEDKKNSNNFLPEGTCSLGPKCIGEGSSDGRNVGKRGVQKLLEVSKIRNDDLFNNPDESYYLHTPCYKAYTRSATASAGMLTQRDAYIYPCKLCDKIFRLRKSFAKHMERHDDQGNINVCNVCKKQLASASSLHSHMKIHTGKTLYRCADCGKTFVSKLNHQVHMKIHSGDYPLACQHCDKRFTLDKEGKFNKHLINHAKAKPHECMECSKSFDRNWKLKLHIRVHTGEKPYKCTLCDKSYQTKQNLKNHQKTHTT